MLYQPTSTSVKYKAKSWIDIFGMRGSKALGSVVTNAFATSIAELVDKGSVVGVGVAGFLIWNARYMGRKFDEYTDAGYIVGEVNDDDVDEDGLVGGDTNNDSNAAGGGGRYKGIEMASRQNDAEETSCATFYEDDEIGIDEEGQSESKSGDNDVFVASRSSSGAVVEMV
jgi:AAA family ATP:ADP antiporter